MSGLKPAAVHLFLKLGPKLSASTHRALATLVPARRALEFYWSAACPYSYLMAQQLSRLTAASDLRVVVRPMSLGSDDVNPSPDLRERHGPRDCAMLAQFYDIDFPSEWTLPSTEAVATAKRVVTRALSLEACVDVGKALWRGDRDGLATAAARHGESSADEANETSRINTQRQRSGGHYHPGCIHYLGEWFEGPMRLELVAERVQTAGHRTALSWSRRPTQSPVGDEAAVFEMWFSFRSPYSYLATAQIQEWRDSGENFQIIFRPVLPMVMRGLAVPLVKKLYLVKDAAREARRLGIPFGRIADPLGLGAERCLAVCAAVTQDDVQTQRAFDFAVAASKSIWSEGIDMATDAGLVKVAARAGISREEVMAALANLPAGLALAESNRDLMIEAGVWGVPSFRSGSLVTWGQDRLPLLRHALGWR